MDEIESKEGFPVGTPGNKEVHPFKTKHQHGGVDCIGFCPPHQFPPQTETK